MTELTNCTNWYRGIFFRAFLARSFELLKRKHGPGGKRGTSIIEVYLAVALLTLIFIFLTSELIQTSQAENFASNHSQTIAVSNYLLEVMKMDGSFWSDWSTGPGTQDPCSNNWPSYTDTIASPTWHPLCASPFPELAGSGVNPQFMWNAQFQGNDPNLAHLTIWVMTDEGGRNDVYELNATRANTAPTPLYTPASPPPSPSPTASPSSPPPPSHTPTPSPKPTPSPTPTPSHTPTPSPTPTGIFE